MAMVFVSIVTDEDLCSQNLLPSTCFTATCSLKNCPAIYVYIHTYVHMYIHTYIRTYIRILPAIRLF